MNRVPNPPRAPYSPEDARQRRRTRVGVNSLTESQQVAREDSLGENYWWITGSYPSTTNRDYMTPEQRQDLINKIYAGVAVGAFIELVLFLLEHYNLHP